MLQDAPCLLHPAQAVASACAAVSCSYWGEALKWGPDNKKQSAGECCQQCMDMQPLDPEETECNGEYISIPH